MNFFREFWQFWAGDEDTQRLAAKRNKAAQTSTQAENLHHKPDHHQYENGFEVDDVELYDDFLD